jgi:hypothetical protein
MGILNHGQRAEEGSKEASSGRSALERNVSKPVQARAAPSLGGAQSGLLCRDAVRPALVENSHNYPSGCSKSEDLSG